MKLGLPSINLFQKQPKPTTGPDFSLTAKVLEKGRTWTRESGFSAQGITKFAGAHLIVPVALVAAAAIDFLVHTLAAVAKAVAIVPRAALYVVSIRSLNVMKSANPTEVIKHLAKAVGSVAAVVPNALVSVFSVNGAIGISNAIRLTNIAVDKAPRTWKQIAKDLGNGVKSIAYKLAHDVPAAALKSAKDHPRVVGAVVLTGAALATNKAVCTYASDYCYFDAVNAFGVAKNKGFEYGEAVVNGVKAGATTVGGYAHTAACATPLLNRAFTCVAAK